MGAKNNGSTSYVGSTSTTGIILGMDTGVAKFEIVKKQLLYNEYYETIIKQKINT